MTIITKLELQDVDAYDWDWFARHGEAVIAELQRAFAAVLMVELPNMGVEEVERLAADYARHRAGELLRLDGEASLVRQTRDRVRQLVADHLESGASLRQLRKDLINDLAFSRTRAEMVARTETATALGQGQKRAATAQGRNEKRWITQADELVDEDCEANAAQGWIPIADPFASGQDTVPAHPACRCSTIYRTAELHESVVPAVVAVVRCPTCGKRAPVNNVPLGQEVYCKRCAATFSAR